MAESWQTSRRSWSSGVNGTWCFDDSTRKTKKRRSRLGDRTLMRSSKSFTCVSSFERRTLLTFQFQEELATGPNAAFFRIRQDAANTHTITSSVRDDAVKTRTSVSGNRRDESKSPQDAHDHQDWTVRLVLHLSLSNHLLLPCRLTPGQLSQPTMNPESNIYIQYI